jgi:hypothetical protein
MSIYVPFFSYFVLLAFLDWRPPPDRRITPHVQIITWFFATPSPETRLALAGKELVMAVAWNFGSNVTAAAIRYVDICFL